ncbi:conjugal transfer protein [Paenibacillus sp. FSL R5-0876]|uniref:conjugal transfer protein n=1 Tax=Paenibacillus sp. FSL R5-0876 TaxID=2921661 RepID=UPI0030FC8F76
MGLFSKNKKKAESDEAEILEASKEEKKKKLKSDKSIKPRAPKTMAPKRALRILFWTFCFFILIRGMVSFARGPQIIEKVTNVESNSPTISDSVKGFATDFATEYFTWNTTNANDRIDRISKFIINIDQDAGLKFFEVKGESRVLSAEIYDSKMIDPTHFDITTLVRREVEMSNTKAPLEIGTDSNVPTSAVAPTNSTSGKTIIKKTYMVVPVTLTDDGPLIETYPRFIGNQQKGASIDGNDSNIVSDKTLLSRGKELSESFLKTYLEGNVIQLKYYYSDNALSPDTLIPSDFTLDTVESITMYKVTEQDGMPDYYRIEASVIVKNDLGELFVNTWTLNATDTNGKFYVLSVGTHRLNEDQTPTNLPISSASPAPEPSSTSTPN